MHADLAAASSHVHLSGWHFSPDFALVRGSKPVVLRNLLAELSERVEVRVLAWGGAPLPLFRPTRATVRRGMDELCRGTRVRYALDTRERPMHCHHEKTIEIDDRVAYVGGIDLSLEGGDRFDSHHHIARAKLGWHDVAARLEGPAVADVAAHFRMRWDEVTGERLEPGPTPQASGGQHHPGGPHRSRARLLGGAARGVPDPGRVPPCAALVAVAHLPGEPVPLVARDRGGPAQEAAPAAFGRVPARAAAPGEAEHRR